MQRVLLAIDGSSGSTQALHWATALAGRAGADLTVLSVFVPAQAELSPDLDRDKHAALAERAAHEWCEPVRAAGVTCSIEVAEGDAASAILRVADRVDADLVVVGSRGTGGFEGLLVGSVADHVAHHTTRPLAIVPASTGEPRLRSLLVAVDDSDGSRAAVELVAGLAPTTGLGVTAAHVFHRAVELWVHEDPRSQYAQAERLLHDEWAHRLVGLDELRGLEVVEHAHVAEGVLAAAHDADADLIVIGARRLGAVTHVRLGGVTMQLIHHSDLPLVIVPPGTAHPDAT